MKSLILSTIIIFCLTVNLFGQAKELNGEYRFKIKREFYSSYYFNKDGFVLFESGDLGSFYGKGKYRLDKNILILSFDTLNLDRTKARNYSIMDPKIDSLTLKTIDKRKFEIEYTLKDGTKFLQGYTRKK